MQSVEEIVSRLIGIDKELQGLEKTRRETVDLLGVAMKKAGAVAGKSYQVGNANVSCHACFEDPDEFECYVHPNEPLPSLES